MTFLNSLAQKFSANEDQQIDILSIAAHEFRNYLTSIINYLSVLSQESKSHLSQEEGVFLDRAFISAQQLSYLVDNLLNVSRIERGVFAVTPQLVNLQDDLIQVAASAKLQASQKNMIFSLNLPLQPLPKVFADLIKINEVLNNLIINAIENSKDGSQIELGAKVEGEEVIVYVADNGTGIPEEFLPKLFTKFFRIPNLANQGKSTGLGLYICKSIIESHHGRIWVESTLRKGSTFYFSLSQKAT